MAETRGSTDVDRDYFIYNDNPQKELSSGDHNDNSISSLHPTNLIAPVKRERLVPHNSSKSLWSNSCAPVNLVLWSITARHWVQVASHTEIRVQLTGKEDCVLKMSLDDGHFSWLAPKATESQAPESL